MTFYSVTFIYFAKYIFYNIFMSSHQGDPITMMKSINSMEPWQFTGQVIIMSAYKLYYIIFYFSDCYWVKIRYTSEPQTNQNPEIHAGAPQRQNRQSSKV